MAKKIRNEDDFFKCQGGCNKVKNFRQFYKDRWADKNNDSRAMQYVPICQDCIKNKIFNNDGSLNIEELHKLLRRFDVPFIQEAYNSAVANGEIPFIFGNYMKQINLKKYQGKHYSDGEMYNDKKELEDEFNIKNITLDEIQELKEKYGEGYLSSEYILFEKKFKNLKSSFALPTSMHEECLAEYCIDKVKEGLAKARGDFKEAKDWASMAKDAAGSGKLNPSQMSKSDLTGGLDGFGQLARMVEQTTKGEIIGLLPYFIEQPKDKVDVNLWCFVNYVRDLLGLPECQYKDIYEFYNIRKKDYESQITDSNINNLGDENG